MKYLVAFGLILLFLTPTATFADLPPGGVTMIVKGEEVRQNDSRLPRTIGDPDQPPISDTLLQYVRPHTPQSFWKRTFRAMFQEFRTLWPELSQEFFDPMTDWMMLE